MTPNDLGALLHYAMRYAMGRYTYAVDDVTRLIRAHWQDITENDRYQIAVDLNEHIQRHERDGRALGAAYVARLWFELLDWMRTQDWTTHKETP